MSLIPSLLFGRPEWPPAAESLRAGPLCLLYEPATGFIRRVRFREHEVLRGLYAAVRDPNWATIPGTFAETRREIDSDGFRIEFQALHQRGEIDFAWHGALTGTADGMVRYTLDGEARTTFRRNRIGFCVLHPIRECVGAAARQLRVDGSQRACRFPETIEPQIPGQGGFRELRALAHEVEPGLWSELSFEGEVFEMEDQRNWTDASFKTYCTPLTLPFPVEIPAGTRIHQSVTLRLEGWSAVEPGTVVEGVGNFETPVLIAPASGPAMRLPHLGLGIASHGQAFTAAQVRRLRGLGLSHLRVDLRLGSSGWSDVWERAAGEAEELGVSVELALHVPRDGRADWQGLRRRFEERRVSLVRVLALREGEAATSHDTLTAVRRGLEGWPIPVGAGSDANFCELNREQALGRCAVSEADFVFWSINPQVHAFDDLSVMETLEAQASTVWSARTFAGGKPLVVSPVTLRQRFNPVATGPEEPPPPGELPPQVDSRQAGLLGAAWTLGSLTELATAGVEAVTYYETTGWRGVLELDEGASLPALFPSSPGAVFPLYHVFAGCVGGGGVELVPVRCSAPRAVAALALGRGATRALLLANLEAAPCLVDVEAFPDLRWVRCLTADNLREAGEDPDRFHTAFAARQSGPLRLPAFGVTWLVGDPGG